MKYRIIRYSNTSPISTSGAESLGFDSDFKYDTNMNNFSRRSTMQSEDSKNQLSTEMRNVEKEVRNLEREFR